MLRVISYLTIGCAFMGARMSPSFADSQSTAGSASPPFAKADGQPCDASATASPKPAATPKDALKLLNSAMRDGDAKQIKSLMFATSPAEVRMVNAMAEVAQAMVELHKAAADAFGPDGARDVTGDTDAESAQGLARIESAEIKVDNDVATVIYIDKKKDDRGQEVTERSEFQLIKAGEGWKVPVAQLAKGATPEVLERRLTELDTQTAIVRAVASEIVAKKYTSAEQAADAWHTKLMQALTPRPGQKKPDSSPTQPTTSQGIAPSPSGRGPG